MMIRIALALLLAAPAAQERKPNIVFILADDLGWGELGSYGQKKIRTPRLDRMAAEGMRFTQFYSGNAVCAPSRCVIMTGKHPGHAFIRANREVQPEGQAPIPAAARTVAEALKDRGYVTGAFGKWGLGSPGSEGDPIRQGFDVFFGYNCQREAHNFYPKHLWKNDRKVPLEGNDRGLTGKQYSHDLIEEEALGFVRANKDRPFFLYVPFTIPHVAMQVPEDSLAEYKGLWEDPPYEGKKGYLPHPAPRAGHAAMITRMDRSVGRLLDLLSELKLDGNTLVCFSSDNGSIDAVGGHDLAFFEANGNLRGQKGNLWEGGIRVPFLARWPGKIKAGAVSDLPAGFLDLFPTFAAVAGADVPGDVDGLSFLPTLLGQEGQKPREFLYWEYPAGGGWQAVRLGPWKGVRTQLAQKKPLELYDLSKDPGEKEDVASKHPELVAKIEAILAREHVRSELFPLPGIDAPAKK
jgi:arylsulfatase